jgi:hypothetical protein
MKQKKKSDPNRLYDLRVILLRDDGDILTYLHEDAKRNERTLPAQVRFMLRQQMEAAASGK